MSSRSLRARAAELGPAVPWLTLAAALLLGAAFTAELARGVDPWRPSAEQLIAIGGNYGLAPGGGGGWRLAIAPLVHLGVLHLAWNLVGLALVLPPLERALGRAAAALVLVGGAAVAGATSFAMSPYTASVGASGATFAAAAAAAVVALRGATSEHDARRGVAVRVAVFGALNAAAPLWFAGIDEWAHLGGAGAGLVAALVLGRRPRIVRLSAGTAALGAATALVLAAAPAPVDVTAAASATVRLERHFDELVPDQAPVPAPDLARQVDAEVVAPLARVRADLVADPRMPAERAARGAELRAYLDARLRVLRLFVRYLDSGDASLRAQIEAAERAADGASAPASPR